MDLTDEFTALISDLQTAKIDFAVCGGWAMGLHWFPRLTNDIDFLVQLKDLPQILGLTVPVVSAAGLAKMKRLSDRPQDLLDIATLGFEPDDPAIQP